MLHPNAILRTSAIEGKGIFASKFIPKGTIIWRLSWDKTRIYTEQDYKKFSPRYRKVIDRYSYPDASENYIFSLENDRYLNHSCDANVLDFPNTPMCIVVRDIQLGEEITYDYALNLRPRLSFKCECSASNCRGIVKRADKKSALYKKLLREEKSAVRSLKNVAQPLLKGTEK